MTMIDREKVIKRLEDCLKNNGCGYMDGIGELYAVSGEYLHETLALLKDQEPRVMPIEEAARNAYSFYHQPDSVKPVFVQFRSERYADESFTPPWRGGVNQRVLLKHPNDYGRDFVFWTDRPTEEQRLAVKWDDNQT